MTNPSKSKLKKGRYTKVRGGNSHLLEISCAKCNTFVVLYQKDGIGSLIRLYLDRMIEPAAIAKWQYLSPDTKIPNLSCPSCQNTLGIPMIYKPENRRAIRLLRGSFIKKAEQ